MKKHHKVGGKPGRPAYRTPSGFKYRKSVENKVKSAKNRAGRRKRNKV